MTTPASNPTPGDIAATLSKGIAAAFDKTLQADDDLGLISESQREDLCWEFREELARWLREAAPNRLPGLIFVLVHLVSMHDRPDYMRVRIETFDTEGNDIIVEEERPLPPS